MALALIWTTLIIAVIFLPLALYLYRSGSSGLLPNIVYGGATWSVIAILQFVVLQIIDLLRPFNIADSISLETITQVQTEARTVLFWYLFFIALFGQIILYIGTEWTITSESAWDFTYFGLGWGISEYVQRFLFIGFEDLLLQLYFFGYTVSIAVAIGSTIVRTAENTKFIMFATFLKFFGEMSLFGGLGYDSDNAMINQLYVLVLIIIMTGLSMLTRKYPMKE